MIVNVYHSHEIMMIIFICLHTAFYGKNRCKFNWNKLNTYNLYACEINDIYFIRLHSDIDLIKQYIMNQLSYSTDSNKYIIAKNYQTLLSSQLLAADSNSC